MIPVYRGMGYIIAIVILLLLVPLLFLLLSRRTTGAGGIRDRSRGITVEEPSADQPSPGGVGDQTAPGTDRRLPPG
jgi:hypothetical protein